LFLGIIAAARILKEKKKKQKKKKTLKINSNRGCGYVDNSGFLCKKMAL
jgi:hypothetical protein